jgi:hypothetical protein
MDMLGQGWNGIMDEVADGLASWLAGKKNEENITKERIF